MISVYGETISEQSWRQSDSACKTSKGTHDCDSCGCASSAKNLTFRNARLAEPTTFEYCSLMCK